MRQTSRNSWLSSLLDAGILAIIIIIPFNATLTVWLSSFLGHYTLLRLWKEIFLIILFAIAAILVFQDRKLRSSLLKSWLTWLMLAYILLHAIVGAYALGRHQVDLKALGYSFIVNLRLIVFFWICLVAAAKSKLLKQSWAKILLIPSALVIFFGLIQQFFLPANFLSHLGYGPHTIAPFETVDQNSSYTRVQSTLRGPNPLGAYLVIVITTLSVCYIKVRRYFIRGLLLIFGIAAVQVLVYTYSRSALLGAMLAVGLSIWFMLLKRSGRIIVSLALVLLVVVGGLAAYHLRHNQRFEDTFLHTSSQTHSLKSSNQNHESALVSGLKDIIHEPQGRGPGTAGPASVYNNHPVRIPEDYYIQIGQEVGLLGLVLFLGINFLVVRQLWFNRQDPLAAVLLYSFVGLFLVNLVSLAWTDETLAYIWWGLAGIASYPGILKAKEVTAHEKQKVHNKASLSTSSSR